MLVWVRTGETWIRYESACVFVPCLSTKGLDCGTLATFMRRWVLPSCVVLALLSFALAQRGTLAKPRTLDDLAHEADRIVQARVVSARVEPHPQYRHLATVLVTIAVDDTIKGSPAKQITYRQFIWDKSDKASLAGYRKGQQLLLFLSKETAEGFTGTAGLNQGRMAIRSANGRSFVHAATPNQKLLAGVDWAAVCVPQPNHRTRSSP
jgi:hypothetical protein